LCRGASFARSSSRTILKRATVAPPDWARAHAAHSFFVDATIIASTSSTKNEAKQRDPQMHQTKKGKQWHHGMKLHIGADTKTGLIHSAVSTAANVHNSQVITQLLHGAETRMYGDSAYRGHKEKITAAAPNGKDFTNERAYKNNVLTDEQKLKNQRKSSVRAMVEHPFLFIKRIWGYAKTRYRGIAKNHNRLVLLCELFNIQKARIVLTG
jgi:transposase, IS5 family